jgi:opacity protein-like surface antigen
MYRMTKFLFAAAALAAIATQGQAQDAAPAPQDQAAPQGNLRGNWLQADQTRQQAQQRADMMFQRLDANRDGTLTRQEVDQAMAQMGQGGGKGGRGGRFAARMADRLFSQGDSVTQAQFEAQALQRFDRQDLNHDGVVTGDERQQGRAMRQQNKPERGS